MMAAVRQVEATFVLDPLLFHGGRIDAARRRWPDAPAPWLDLSTGINPHRWAGAVAVDHAPLPDVSALDALCRGARAAFGGADDGAVAALPGTEIGLHLLAALDLPRPYMVVGPGYRTHCAALPGAASVSRAEAERWSGTGTLLLANPNNPDGDLWGTDRLLDLVARAGRGGGWLIVDEAFVDALPDAGVLPLLRREDRALVFRSFGKFYGLAGVRLGFACGAPALVERIAAWLGSWPVSAAAIAIGTAAYRDAGWRAAMPRRLAREAGALDRVLARHGLTGMGACPLFRLVEDERAPAIFARLARAGILVRPFEDARARLRFGLPGSDDALARLDRALRDG